jgi:catechol 2,3-dioxygenase-like lactoylglutathione lyase family enzyme
MDHTISLATADRGRSLVFYRDGLGLEAFGPLADDGIPEPLQFRLAWSVSLMLIPTGGFGWFAGEDRVAPPGANECVLSVYVSDEHAARVRYEAALAAGGTTVYEPSRQEWGSFAAQVADPDGHLWMVLVRPDDWAG